MVKYKSMSKILKFSYRKIKIKIKSMQVNKNYKNIKSDKILESQFLKSCSEECSESGQFRVWPIKIQNLVIVVDNCCWRFIGCGLDFNAVTHKGSKFNALIFIFGYCFQGCGTSSSWLWDGLRVLNWGQWGKGLFSKRFLDWGRSGGCKHMCTSSNNWCWSTKFRKESWIHWAIVEMMTHEQYADYCEQGGTETDTKDGILHWFLPSISTHCLNVAVTRSCYRYSFYAHDDTTEAPNNVTCQMPHEESVNRRWILHLPHVTVLTSTSQDAELGPTEEEIRPATYYTPKFSELIKCNCM